MEAFYAEALEAELVAVREQSVPDYLGSRDTWSHVEGRLNAAASHSLFSAQYAHSYFGLRQCIEIDALRCSFDRNLESAAITIDQHAWLVLAMCKAMSVCATNTGHFAQPLAPKESNIVRFSGQRNKSVWEAWSETLPMLQPFGHSSWRKRNRATRMEANERLGQISQGRAPGVIYADPPYTTDHYSRYYHLYETAVLYDYPDAVGHGLYRSDRLVSDFSLATKVRPALEALIAQSATIGSDLLISYPTNGLLPDSRNELPKMLKHHYKVVDAHEFAHQHSTMGASKGEGKALVTEVIYRARL